MLQRISEIIRDGECFMFVLKPISLLFSDILSGFYGQLLDPSHFGSLIFIRYYWFALSSKYESLIPAIVLTC